MRPTKAIVLFDATGTANTAFDSGALDTTDFDVLAVEILPSGAAAASTLSFYDLALSASQAVFTVATPATAATKTAAWGPGEVAAVVGERLGGQGGVLPASVKIGIGALGAGITAHIRVLGRRMFREGTGVYNPITHVYDEAV